MTFHVPLPMIRLLNYHDRCQMAFKVPRNDRYWAFGLVQHRAFFFMPVSFKLSLRVNNMAFSLLIFLEYPF